MPPSVGTIVCPACSGAVPKNAAACPYCGAIVVLPAPKGSDLPAETRTYCTRCGDLYPSAAARCPRCPPGSTDERGGRCPRCAGDLSPTAEGGVPVDRCGRCRGVWFDGDELEHVANLTTRGVPSSEARTMRRALPAGNPEGEVRYLACVRCQERMARRMVAPRTGIIVDICRAHGVWFDGGELDAFLAFVKAGGLEVARHDGIASAEAKRKEGDARRRAGLTPSPRSSFDLDASDGTFLGLSLARVIGGFFRQWPF